MWIFGYGSLIWKVDFPYKTKEIGYIKGYVRRFWQASIDHRGTPEKPGRVATLVPSEDPESRVWGVAYELDEHHPDAAAARDRLTHRERWFEQRRVPFWCATFTEDASDSPPAQQSLVLPQWEVELFIATSEGPNFLGAAPPEQLAREIVEPHGPSGKALEYFQRVLEFQRGLGHEARDEHLEILAPLVERAAAELAEKEVCLERDTV